MITNSTVLRAIKMACCGFAVAMAAMPSSAYAAGEPGLLWQNTGTGEIGAWMLNNGPTPTGTLDLSVQCGPANDCVLLWTPVQTSGNRILWDNRIGGTPGGGELGYWQFDGNGNVTVEPALADTCVPGGGCGSGQNQAIGNVTLNLPQSACPVGPTPCTYQGILWVDPADGNVVIWNMSNEMLGGTAPGASASVDVSPPGQAILTVDINGDGNTDILWYDKTSGLVSVSLLGGDIVSQRNFAVLGTQILSSTCSVASGCAGEWEIIGAADVNGDGHVDLTWFNAGTGQVSSWLLDGQGNVTGTQTLSWTCSLASGCAAGAQVGWRPLGYVTFPPPCGGSGQAACTTGNACDPGLSVSGSPAICCPADAIGVSGVCDSCGVVGELACPGGICNGAQAVDEAGRCVACGVNETAPCPTTGCEKGTVLISGECTTCGASGQVPCATGCNNAHLAIVHGVCTPCGALDQVCCLQPTCNAGLACMSTSNAAGQCVAVSGGSGSCPTAGAPGCNCTSAGTCNAGSVCIGDTCVTCGATSEACCAGETCKKNSGLTCQLFGTSMECLP